MTSDISNHINGTIGGTLITLIAIIPNSLITAAEVACVGATVSYLTSYFLKRILERKEDK